MKTNQFRAMMLVRLNLMYVIHIVGDMHCPSHVKYPGCKSGCADLNGKKMSYHAMWDWGEAYKKKLAQEEDAAANV